MRGDHLRIYVIRAVLIGWTALSVDGCYLNYAGAADRSENSDQIGTLGVHAEVSIEQRTWFVSPQGKPTGDGSMKSPLDLETALDGKSMRARIAPGDVVYLRRGTFAGKFTSTLEGTPAAPIRVQGYPGERVVIDKNSVERDKAALTVRGDNVWFQDLEITNSSPERGRLDADGEMDPWRGSGINIFAANTKYINLVLHDNGHAFGLWNEDGGTEIYGCVMFNNGNNKKEHGVYAHNRTGTQLIRDNVILNGAGYGLHIYANSAKSSLSGFDIEGNAIFNNGTLMSDDQVSDQILVGGVKGVPAERITIRENYIYTDPDAATSKSRGIRLGYRDEGNRDVKVLNNYIASKVPLKILWWNSVEVSGNTIFSTGTDIEIETAAAGKADYRIGNNVYLTQGERDPMFVLDKKRMIFAQLQGTNGPNRTAKVGSTVSESLKVFIRPNTYESGRANIVIYNWAKKDKVPVDLSSVLAKGDKYAIYDSQDYLGEPVVSGTFDGKAIAVPMKLSSTTRPVGNVERVPEHTGPEFGVFVVRKRIS
jgi:hypothetical protein